MEEKRHDHPVLELRLALTTRDFDRMVNFYSAGLGLEPAQVWESWQGRGLVLELGRATLELFDEKQAATVDDIEVGRRVSGLVRLALQVPDLERAMESLLAQGGSLVHPPVETPWGDYNVRLQDPEGMQITLFQSKQAEP
jgi:methylmalonyl-CoA/ethylmalonyl-CoA epimerase